LRANVMLHQGRLREAEEDARLGFELTVATSAGGAPAGPVWACAHLIEVLLSLGETGQAEEALARMGLVDRYPATYARSLLLGARGRLNLLLGRPGEALDDALASAPPPSGTNPACRPWRSDAARALRVLGRADEAVGLAAEELRLARAFGTPGAISVALRALAACEKGETTIELLREAAELTRRSEARLEHAHALVELGAALRRSKQRAVCREPLSAGLDLAHRCGAQRLAEQARAELLAAGARPRRMAITGAESLTPANGGWPTWPRAA